MMEPHKGKRRGAGRAGCNLWDEGNLAQAQKDGQGPGARTYTTEGLGAIPAPLVEAILGALRPHPSTGGRQETG